MRTRIRIASLAVGPSIVMVIGLSVLVAILIGGLYVGGVHVTHRRDEAAYLKVVAEDAQQAVDEGATPVPLPASDLLVAEGQRACDWLNAQPHALWRSGNRFKPVALMNRYVAVATTRPDPWSGTPDEPFVAEAAWQHLCPASLQMRRPLPGFRGPSD